MNTADLVGGNVCWKKALLVRRVPLRRGPVVCEESEERRRNRNPWSADATGGTDRVRNESLFDAAHRWSERWQRPSLGKKIRAASSSFPYRERVSLCGT